MATSKFIIESGVQLLARLMKKPELENFYPVLFEGGLQHGNIVDISGNMNTSDLLIDLICAALLPNQEQVGVLFLNTIGKFNYRKFINILDRKLTKMNHQVAENEIASPDRTLTSIMSNLYLLEIYDANQYYTSIHNLDNILALHPNISLIIIDSLTAFYWSEQGFKITKMDLYIKSLLRMIQKLSKDYKVIFVYTRPENFSSNKDCDNIETCDLTDGVNIKVQILDSNSKGHYQVNVRTFNSYYKKFYNLIDNEINWQ